jgi:predicted amidophosphoribosyltransferase
LLAVVLWWGLTARDWLKEMWLMGGGSLRCSVCNLNYPHEPLKYGTCAQCGGQTSWSSSKPNLTADEIAELGKEPEKYPDVFLELTVAQRAEWEREWATVDLLVERSGGMFGDAEIWLSVTQRKQGAAE